MSNSGNWIRKTTRRAIYTRDGWRCVYCGSQESLTLDHVVSRYSGGGNGPDNVVTACKACNDARGATALSPDDLRKAKAATRKRITKLRTRAFRDLFAMQANENARCPWCPGTCSNCLKFFLDPLQPMQ